MVDATDGIGVQRGAPTPETHGGESPRARLNREYAELLQEVRIAQGGIQIMFASLLALGVTPAFTRGDTFERVAYCASLLCAVGAAGTLMAPAVLHRLMHGRGLKRELITAAHRYLLTGMCFLALAISLALVVTLDFALGLLPALVGGTAALTWFAAMWLLTPVLTRNRAEAARNRTELAPDTR
ncbi:DUF6328 family protein [Yinghuangia seranimata]|uniref:DUF6328 family protein n=1 Tax=Yinghuangia seranimata TaxID=408067 RepID=UPI00248CC9D6|nr:DUF6328 family protein [Yinghuangia seranimata]MDI2126982.1 DUF6328 family protein [Yinghuangia seranimata]